ncbi:hypothetical protein BDN72DRAFT_452759 [Pluteus cervinus]|uniref:Uncharacterized protein n=1 Tax=Pluteus cervinus TaxID=181527 RepID=A0ACD3BCB1_9AGAR|nr:hypothetical protein BDN72DRAFT_452759 [Pluteus cervinus]
MPTFVLSTIVALCFALHVYAGIFVITPAVDSVCYGGQPCEVRWLDDGSIPLLNAFGLSEVGVYTGNQQLVQRLPPVDVSDTHTLEFTVMP